VPKPQWKRFEELVAEIQKDLAPEGFVVTPNDKIIGLDSEAKRQIDVSMRGTVGQFDVLMILDAKDKNKPVDVKGLEEFMGLAHDVRAQRAGMVSAKGFTEAAKKKAKKVGIDLYTLIDSKNAGFEQPIVFRAVCEVSNLKAYQLKISGSPLGGFSISTAALSDPRAMQLFDSEHRRLGTVNEFLRQKWWTGGIEFAEGSWEDVEIIPNPIYIPDAMIPGKFVPMNVHVTLHVEKRYYTSEVPLKEIRGLKNEITGRQSIVKNLVAQTIEFAEIEKSWERIEKLEQLAVQPLLHIRVLEMAS
jgi:hypothetical protein